MTLAGWGRVPVVTGEEIRSEDLERITRDMPLTRGLGRAYGDAALPASPDTRVAGSRLADRILSLDADSGALRAEAGLSLSQLYDVFLPRGFFTPVTPGTRFVTLGGMVAADVHGKNHHRDGCFGEHVTAITLRVGDGRIVTCTPTENAELFRATIGGMGLTGHILEVGVRLVRVPTPWILQETERIPNVDRFIDALREASGAWPMTVGWIDCLSQGAALGRGILFRGRWAERHEAPATMPRSNSAIEVPFTAPGGLLRPATVRMFNAAYYWKQSRAAGRRLVDPQTFFYPLDAIGNWNRLYGPRGFVQYQCVLPHQAGHSSARRFLQLVTDRASASFLCVIKDCGPEGRGMLSFPKPGISVALDLPFGDGTQALVDEMNTLVINEGGRIYLAKDALTRAEHYRAMDPRVDEFLRLRREWDPQGRIRSALSVRLFGW
jgi:decaprenylphospho-beta-D-ribofuranose 2-oxidase